MTKTFIATWPQVRTDEPFTYEGPREDGLWTIKHLVTRSCYVTSEEAAIQYVAYENWRYQHPKAAHHIVD